MFKKDENDEVEEGAKKNTETHESHEDHMKHLAGTSNTFVWYFLWQIQRQTKPRRWCYRKMRHNFHPKIFQLPTGFFIMKLFTCNFRRHDTLHNVVFLPSQYFSKI